MDEPAVPRVAASRPSLRRNIVYSIVGMGFLNLCRLGVLVLLAKFATAELLGRYTYSMALTAPVVLFFTFQLRSALVSDARDELPFPVYRMLRNLLVAAAAVVLVAVVGWELLYGTRLTYVLILAGVCAARCLWALNELNGGVYQKRERQDLWAWSNALRGITLILPFATLLPILHWNGAAAQVLERAVGWAVFLYAGAWLVLLLTFDRPHTSRLLGVQPTWDWSGVRRLAAQTFPLALVILLVTLCETLPLIALRAESGDSDDVGYFGAMLYVAMVGNLVVLQTGQTIAHRLALYYQTDLRAFLRLALRFGGLAAAIGVAVVAVTYLFGEWFLSVVYRPEYAEHFPAFLTLAIAQAVLLLVHVFGISATHMRLFWVQVPVQLTVLAATLVTALLLIPRDPINGAAVTALVRAVTQAVLYAGCVVGGVVRRWRDGSV